MKKLHIRLLCLVLVAFLSGTAAAQDSKPIRVGIIGLDTGHVIAFTKILNDPKAAPEVANCRVVAAYPKGSPDIESSVSRVPKYTEDIQKLGVKIVDSIDDLVKQVDAVLLESNDGRPHLEQARPVIAAGKPLFIDKPIAGSLKDAIKIFREAKKAGVPVFSSSSLRYGKNSQAARAGSLGKIQSAETHSPASLEKTHPDLFWYGIHGVESLFTVMGTGCESVVRTSVDGKIVVTGRWKGGRTGIFREGKGYGGKAKGDKGEGAVGSYDGYRPLVVEIVKFFRTGKPPVSSEETLEIYAFMEAADESKRQGGAEVLLESVMRDAAEGVAEALPRVKPMSPEESLKAMVVRPGIRVELAAAEPLIHDPVAAAFDEQERMYVAQVPSYNAYVLKDFNKRGSIALLEDKDGDGRYDTSVAFADDLDYPTALACWDGGLFVGDAPDLLWLKDTDGDGRADERRVVFTGFGTDKAGESHLNSIWWGLDNRFHLSTSLVGGNVVATAAKGAKPVSVRGRGFTFDPRDLTRFELTTGGGQHGMSVDDWGRVFTCGNSKPALTLMYDDRYIARNPHLKAPKAEVNIAPDGKFTQLFRISPPEPWRQLRTRLRKTGKFRGSDEGGRPFGFFTGATGITIYRGDALPRAYLGNAFVGEVSNNMIYRAKVTPNGVGVTAARADKNAEFIASRDIWFRPVQFANAPDGSLYVLDMYRELIEGAAFLPPEFLKYIPADSGNDMGRIYRITSTHRGSGRASASTNGSGSEVSGFTSAATRVGKGKKRQISAKNPATLVALLDSRNGWHRDTALRLIYQAQDKSIVPALKKLSVEATLPEGRAAARSALDGLGALDEDAVLGGLNDESPEARIHALQLAEKFAADSAAVRAKVPCMVPDLSLPVRYQLAFSLGSMPAPAAASALADLALQDGADGWMRMAIQSSLERGADLVFERLAGDASFRKTSHGAALLSALAEQIGAAGRDSEIAATLRSIQELRGADKALSGKLVKALVSRQSGERRKQTLAAAGGEASAIMAGLLKKARATAGNPKAKEADRIESIRSLRLAAFGDVRSLISGLLKPTEAPPIQSAALEAASGFADAGVADLLLGAWQGLSPKSRATAAETLLSRQAWLAKLLDAIEAGKVKSFEIDPARVQLLRQHPDEKIVARVNRLFVDARKSRQEVVERYQAALKKKGDPELGKMVFRGACATCHQLEGVGNEVGADLKGIRQRGMASVLLNILDPNREVKPEFMVYALETRDGRILAGMIGAETTNDVTIRQIDGTSIDVRRVDIKSLKSLGMSFMPEGLEFTLDVPKMADLLAYLDSIQ